MSFSVFLSVYDSFTDKVQHVWVVQEDKTLSAEALKNKQLTISGFFTIHKRRNQNGYEELSPMAKLLKHIMAMNSLQNQSDTDCPEARINSV